MKIQNDTKNIHENEQKNVMHDKDFLTNLTFFSNFRKMLCVEVKLHQTNGSLISMTSLNNQKKLEIRYNETGFIYVILKKKLFNFSDSNKTPFF